MLNSTPNIRSQLRVIPKLFLLAALPFVLAGCSLGVGGADGSKDEFVKGAVAKGFPNLPLYPKSQVVESYAYQGDFGASFVVGKSLADVTKFYQEFLPKSGWESSASQVAQDNYVFDVKNSEYEGRIIVNTAADSKKTAITISASKKEK